jgi:hypothetical protein
MNTGKRDIYKKISDAKKTASELRYDKECQKRLSECKSEAEIEAVMVGARKRLKDR